MIVRCCRPSRPSSLIRPLPCGRSGPLNVVFKIEFNEFQLDSHPGYQVIKFLTRLMCFLLLFLNEKLKIIVFSVINVSVLFINEVIDNLHYLQCYHVDNKYLFHKTYSKSD